MGVLLEPCMRGTAPCICYASWKIKKRDPRATIVVAPSDHNVKDVASFAQCIGECLAKVGTAVPIAIRLKANKSVCCLVAHLLAFLFSIINDVVVDSLI